MRSVEVWFPLVTGDVRSTSSPVDDVSEIVSSSGGKITTGVT